MAVTLVAAFTVAHLLTAGRITESLRVAGLAGDRVFKRPFLRIPQVLLHDDLSGAILVLTAGVVTALDVAKGRFGIFHVYFLCTLAATLAVFTDVGAEGKPPRRADVRCDTLDRLSTSNR